MGRISQATRQPRPHRHEYPTPGAFPMGGVAGTREAPSNEGASVIFGTEQKRTPSVVSENAPLF